MAGLKIINERDFYLVAALCQLFRGLRGCVYTQIAVLYATGMGVGLLSTWQSANRAPLTRCPLDLVPGLISCVVSPGEIYLV